MWREPMPYSSKKAKKRIRWTSSFTNITKAGKNANSAASNPNNSTTCQRKPIPIYARGKRPTKAKPTSRNTGPTYRDAEKSSRENGYQSKKHPTPYGNGMSSMTESQELGSYRNKYRMPMPSTPGCTVIWKSMLKRGGSVPPNRWSTRFFQNPKAAAT